MALRAKWTLRLEGVQTQLAFGAAAQADVPQPLQVSLVINGLTPDTPVDGADCLDHETICRWIVDEWPKSPATPLLETRVNELLDFIFGFDKRVQDAWVGLYRSGLPGGAARIGVERQVSRSQVQARSRMARA